VQWVSVGTLLIVGFWLLASLAFGFYLRVIANYGTVFGNLATVVVAMAYIYLSALALLAGAVLDAILRKHVEGT
jgi:membrane protein